MKINEEIIEKLYQILTKIQHKRNKWKFYEKRRLNQPKIQLNTPTHGNYFECCFPITDLNASELTIGTIWFEDFGNDCLKD